MPQDTPLQNSELVLAAKDLLPLFLSHFPQQNLDISLRSLIERTAILSHNQKAMLSSILNPFVGKNGKAMTSILPHLTREFPNEETTEILLRPRMPLVPSTGVRGLHEEGTTMGDEDEDMQMDEDNFDTVDTPIDQNNAFDGGNIALQDNTSIAQEAVENQPGLGNSTLPLSNTAEPQHSFGNPPPSAPTSLPSSFDIPMDHQPISSRSEDYPTQPQLPAQASRETLLEARIEKNLDDAEDSDDESVHLTMELDTDSESEG